MRMQKLIFWKIFYWFSYLC